MTTLPTRLVAFIGGKQKHPSRFYTSWRDAQGVANTYANDQRRTYPRRKVRYLIRMAKPDELVIERLLIVMQHLYGMRLMNSIVRRQLRIAIRPLVNENRRITRRATELADQISQHRSRPRRRTRRKA